LPWTESKSGAGAEGPIANKKIIEFTVKISLPARTEIYIRSKDFELSKNEDEKIKPEPSMAESKINMPLKCQSSNVKKQ
jgi:hypothetical protein